MPAYILKWTERGVGGGLQINREIAIKNKNVSLLYLQAVLLEPREWPTTVWRA
jgi:hypothetical protein